MQIHLRFDTCNIAKLFSFCYNKCRCREIGYSKINLFLFQNTYNTSIPGETGAKDKNFSKLHRAVWNEDIESVKKYVKVDHTSIDTSNKFGSSGKSKLKLAAASFVGTGKG